MPDPHHDAPLMLGVSGLRGIVGKSLTPEVAVRYAAAFGSHIAERDNGLIVVARDGRLGGESLHAAVIAGLLGTGHAVADLGVATTPTVGFMVDHLNAYGAMIVTASHNPQEWNGLKCLVRDMDADAPRVDACAPNAATAAAIIERFKAGEIDWAAPDRLDRSRPHNESAGLHAAETAQSVLVGDEGLLNRSFRVVVDSVNSSGGPAADLLLHRLNGRVTQIAGASSGVFPHTPEPTRENLGELCAAVQAMNADIGFAQDPDADRLAIIDERGRYIGEEYTLALAALALLTAPAPTPAADRVICTNLSTSRMIDDIAARHGARVVRTPVGEANVVEAMKREKAAGRDVVLGGEGNGGVIWPRVTYVRDSLSAMALVLALMARTGKTVSQLVADIPAYAIEKRKVDLARKEDARPAIDKLAAAYASHRLDLQDGVRIDFDATKSWLHVRASNTEPIMRLIAEAPTPAQATALLDEAARIIAS